jgi:WD40 repeat protein
MAYKYKAFISYSHATDQRLAPALQSALHRFAKPWYLLRSMRVFRDRTNLSANPHLWSTIETALGECEFLLLFASPSAAHSPWVEREMTWWLEHRQSVDKLLILLTDGELVWDARNNDYDWQRTTSLPPSMAGRLPEEALYVDLRWARGSDELTLRASRFRGAVLDIAATLLGRDKDALDGEDVRQHRRNRIWASSAAAALAVTTLVAVGTALVAYYQKEIALSRQLAASAELLIEQPDGDLRRAVLLAAEGLHRADRFAFLGRAQAFEADQALQTGLGLLGPPPVLRLELTGGLKQVLSPRGRYLARVPFEGPIRLVSLPEGEQIATLGAECSDSNGGCSLRGLAFSADGNRVAARSNLGITALVWNLPSGQPIFQKEEGGICAITLSPSGDRVATGHIDGSIHVWNVDTGDLGAQLRRPSAPRTMRFSPDGRLLAVTSSLGIRGNSDQAIVGLWDLSKSTKIARLQHDGAVTEMVFSPDSSILATTRRVGAEQELARQVGTVSLWETVSGKRRLKLEHEEQVTSLVFHREGKYLLSGSRDGTARLWDVANGEKLVTFDHGDVVTNAGFIGRKFDTYVWTAGNNGVLRLWRPASPVLEVLRLPQEPSVIDVAANEDHLVTIGHDPIDDVQRHDPRRFQREVQVWSLADLRRDLPLEHKNVVAGARFADNGRLLATFDVQTPDMQLIPASENEQASFVVTNPGSGRLNLWDVATHERRLLIEHAAAVTDFDITADGTHLASACADGKARIFSAKEGRELAQLQQEGWVYNVRFSPDGRRLAVTGGPPELFNGGAGQARLSVWNWETGKTIGEITSDQVIDRLAFSGDGRLLVAGGWDGMLYLIDVASGDVAAKLRLDDPVRAVAITHDGSWLAAGTGGSVDESSLIQQGKTVLWHTGADAPVVMAQSAGWVTSVAFSPDGKHLASVDQEGQIGVWKVQNGRQLASLSHGASSAEAVVHFSPDGRYLVSAVHQSAKLWDLGSGQEIARRGHLLGSLWEANFSPDGKWLVTASTDTTAVLWLWRPDDLIAEACRRVPADVSEDQWACEAEPGIHHYDPCVGLVVPANCDQGRVREAPIRSLARPKGRESAENLRSVSAGLSATWRP